MPSTAPKSAQPRQKPDSPAQPPEKPTRKETNRDFVEQIVVAFILAFLVRGFEAEAFVIPTGSMAPTLYGQHKEVTCPQCGFVFAVNASHEEVGLFAASRPSDWNKVNAGTCTNCRYLVTNLGEAPSFKGDRILVNKFIFDLPFLPGATGPRRWDVIVFHNPEEPEVNYIKRLVGLPDEDLRIYYGDILTRPRAGDSSFKLQRKPLYHQQAMQMMVWDDSHRPRAFEPYDEWRRWRPKAAEWSEPRSGAFESAASEGSAWSSLVYRNLIPDPAQWRTALSGERPTTTPRSSLVTDMYSYNSQVTGERRLDPAEWFKPNWVGDLTLSCRIEPRQPKGKLRLELVEGGIINRCEIDLATGLAVMYRGEDALGDPVATPLKDRSAHDVTFANVDDRLTLWVDGRTPFGDGVVYDTDPENHPAPTAEDLEPARISTQAANVRLSDLVLKRDIYYTLEPDQFDSDATLRGTSGNPERRVAELLDFLSDPAQFAALGHLHWSETFTIAPHSYMMLGDNSPMSKDSRAWTRKDQDWDPSDRASWEVPESMLIGKAFFVYWPHGKPFGPDIRLGRDFRIPFRPYFERMKWIR